MPGMSQIIDELLAMEHLSDDYDGEGSRAPSRATVDAAVMVLGEVGASEAPLPDDAEAGRGGEVRLIWGDGKRRFEVEVEPSGRLSWLAYEATGLPRGGVLVPPPLGVGLAEVLQREAFACQ